MADGKSYWSIKRADYQQALYEAAVEVGCDIRLGQKVSGIDEDAPAVSIDDKATIRGDLILIADGRFRKSTIEGLS